MFHFGWFKMVSTWGLVEHVQLWSLLYLLTTLELYKQNKIGNHFAMYAKFGNSSFELHCQWSIHNHTCPNQ
jgi:hypothetical protein